MSQDWGWGSLALTLTSARPLQLGCPWGSPQVITFSYDSGQGSQDTRRHFPLRSRWQRALEVWELHGAVYTHGSTTGLCSCPRRRG